MTKYNVRTIKTLKSMIFVAALLLCDSSAVFSQHLPTLAFFEPPAVDDIKISPDGLHLALTISEEESSRLVVIRLSNRESVASFVTNRNEKIGEFHWVNDERIVFTKLRFYGGFDQPFRALGLFGLNIDDTKKFQLTGSAEGITDLGIYDLIHLIPMDSEHVRVSRRPLARRLRSPTRPSAYLLDVYGNRLKISKSYITNLSKGITSPLRSGNLFADRDGEVRLAIAEEDDGTFKVSYRHKSDWVNIESRLLQAGRHLESIEFASFDSDNESFYYLASSNKGTKSLYRFAYDKEEPELIFQHPIFDTHRSNLIFASDLSTILGVGIAGDSFEKYYFADHPETIVNQKLDALFADDFAKITSATRDGKQGVLVVYGPKRIGDFFIFDAETLKIEPVFSISERLPKERMAEVIPFGIKSPDGFVLHGYITQPKNTPEPLPLIVLPHDGPTRSRDLPFFDREAQFFAQHGFAVLQINYRGSSGYGIEFEDAAMEQWGTGIIDDITLATRWAVQRGIADENKICIYGTGFGGYAALMSVIREPTRYRCAVGFAGVYDLTKMDRSEIPWQSSGDAYLDKIMGTDEDLLVAQSPVYNAHKVEVPVFLIHGGQDRRAPAFHSREMRAALRDEDVEPRWLFRPREGHSFYLTENKVIQYEQILDFIKTNTN